MEGGRLISSNGGLEHADDGVRYPMYRVLSSGLGTGHRCSMGEKIRSRVVRCCFP